MKVFRISKCRYITDLSGKGAALYGGRWNSRNHFMLYTSGSASLAMLETIVHLSGIPAVDFCMAEIEIPGSSVLSVDEEELPKNWKDFPSPAALRLVGDNFLKNGGSLALRVPSAIIPEEHNYLLNPQHPLFKKCKLLQHKKISLDARLKQ